MRPDQLSSIAFGELNCFDGEPTDWCSVMGLTSFISEHTAEFAIVPELRARLTPHFALIIPIYFWSTREGSTAGQAELDGFAVQILTVFPRRPKLSDKSKGAITMKINAELIQYAESSWRSGIPAIAALPHVMSLNQLAMPVRCTYYDLRDWGDQGESLVDVSGLPCTEAIKSKRVGGALANDELISISGGGTLMCWREAIGILKHVRSSTLAHSFPFFGGYKPFHMILSRSAALEEMRGAF